MGIHHSIVILLLVLCASMCTYGQTEEEVEERYKKFIRQHVFGAMNIQRCDSEIRTRRIMGSQNDNSCKEVNTFILANNKQVKSVCTGGGTPVPSKKRLVYEQQAISCSYMYINQRRETPQMWIQRTQVHSKDCCGVCRHRPTHYEEGVIV